MPDPTDAVVVTTDLALLDHVLACAAAGDARPQVHADPSELRSTWTTASVVVVGVDQAERVLRLGLARRSDVFVVGEPGDREELMRWSGALGAAVVEVPDGAAGLTAAIADAAVRRSSSGLLVTVVGGCGGVGASTLAVALGVGGARRGLTSLVVDADPWSAGLDLLVGAEDAPGWRWPTLRGARGHLGDLSDQLPTVDGLSVLSAGRQGSVGGAPGPDQLAAVITSTRRTHDLTVVDLARTVDPPSWAATRSSDLTLVVARADVRGVAAARSLQPRWSHLGDVRAVVRGRQPGLASAEACAEGLGLVLAGVLPDEPAVRLAAERGDPPGRLPRSALGRVVARLLDELAASRLVA